VQVADENSGTLQYYGAIANTGMKLITVTVVWMQGTETKKMQLRSIMSDIDATMMNCAISGTITNAAGGAAIPAALVTIAENMGYRDTASSAGQYVINLSPGSYSMYVSANGFFWAVPRRLDRGQPNIHAKLRSGGRGNGQHSWNGVDEHASGHQSNRRQHQHRRRFLSGIRRNL
jgi:hypothetical protein